LIRQFFTESMLLCMTGGLLGILAGSALTNGLRAIIPAYELPAEADVRMDGSVVAFAVIITIAAGVISSLIPAVQSTRFDLAGAMKQNGPNSSADRQGRNLRRLLVVIEVALAFLLLAGAGLLIRSFAHLQQIEVISDPSHLVLSDFPVPAGQSLEPTAFLSYLGQVADKLRTVPGVKNVAIGCTGPLQGAPGVYYQIVGRSNTDAAHRPVCGFKAVTPSYFATIGMRAVRGRLLETSDHASGQPVVVINETMAKKYFPHEDPLGQHLLIQPIVLSQSGFGSEVSYEVVGIVTGERIDRLDNQVDYECVYVPIDQAPTNHLNLAVRSSIKPTLLEQQLVHAVHEVNRDQTLPHMQTLEERKIRSLDFDHLRTTLLGAFAGIALTLAVVGIYGVLSYTVTQRTREIGIRMALGSSAAGILALTLREGMTLVAAGLALGFVAALDLSHLLKSALVGVEDHDPATLVAAALILTVASFFACYLPARRAIRVSPLVALGAD
jgi:putative ABC transport system permease protein